MKAKPKRILWPTDFSELSEATGQYARDLCDLFGAELHIVHVCAPPLSPDIEALLPTEICSGLGDDELREATRTRLQRLVREQFANDTGIICEALVGTPWSGICAYAQRAGIDLIVLATHGLTGLRHVLIGSTADRVVQHAHCPVLTVRSQRPGPAAR